MEAENVGFAVAIIGDPALTLLGAYLHFRSSALYPRDVTILVRELFPRLAPAAVQRAVSPHVAATSLPSRQVEQTLMFYA